MGLCLFQLKLPSGACKSVKSLPGIKLPTYIPACTLPVHSLCMKMSFGVVALEGGMKGRGEIFRLDTG